MSPHLKNHVAAMLASIMVANRAQDPVTESPGFVTMSETQESSIDRREDGEVR